MKLTIFLLFVTFLHVSANGLGQKITLNEKGASLEKVFKEIRKQIYKETGYGFLYNMQQLQSAPKVDVVVTNATLEEALKVTLQRTNFTYTIQDRTIVISPKEKKVVSAVQEVNPLLTKEPLLVPVVHGRVTNEKGEPVAGVNISLKGGKVIGVTDDNGAFTLKDIDENAVLVFSAITIEPYEVKLNGRTNLVLAMMTKISQLEDVVVNKGYYSTTQRQNTGNVTKVKGEDIRRQPISDPITALEGKVPGLFIKEGSGTPGVASTIRLRGQNSIQNGNDPLFVVDGVPITSTSISGSFGGGAFFPLSPFNSINPNDIESIEVLKDTDATAIYGSRGANGVILITTRKGNAGKTQFDANVYTGTGSITRKMDLMNTQQYLQMRHEALNNDSRIPSASSSATNPFVYAQDIMLWDTTRYTDWQKVLIGGTSKVVDAQMSISGGNATTQFLISSNYRNNTTVFPGDFYSRRFSGHSKISHQSVNQRLRINLSIDYVSGLSFLPNEDLTNYITYAPDAPSIYDGNGNLNWQNNTWTNPLASIRKTNKSMSQNLIGNLGFSYKIFDGLDFSANLGYTNYDIDETGIVPLSSYPPTATATTLRQLAIGHSKFNSWNVEPQLNYRKKIGNGQLNVLMGTTFLDVVRTGLTILGRGFGSDDLIENLQNAATAVVSENTYSKYNYNKVYGRVSYNLNEKYLFNATASRDGSTRYGPENRFGNFAAIGTGWIFSKERFAKSLSFLSFGKLRASYGSTGNDQIGDYAYIPTYSTYPYAYQGLTGLTPTGLPNPTYGWETIKKLEGGIELGFFKDRINVKGSYYRNQTDNQIVQAPLPSLTGGTSFLENLPAVVRNSGLEIELASTNYKAIHVSWTTNFNISFPRNKLVAFPGIEKSNYSTRYVVGKSLFVQYLLHYKGVDPLTGAYTFEDVDKDGKISFPNDYSFSKQIAQSYFGSLSNNVKYQNFEFDFTFYFVKQTGINYLKKFGAPGSSTVNNQPTFIISDHWRAPGDITSIQRYTFGSGTQAFSQYSLLRNSSDAVVDDASFIRLRNVSISYTLPKSWQQKLHMQNARIYVQGQNLITITKYKGLDPETGSSYLPPLRMITAGAQLTF